MTIIANLKRPWFRMLPDVAEKINDADDFGLEHALKAERRRLREKEKKRRQRARQIASKAIVAVQAERQPVATFVTASGQRAYTETEPRTYGVGVMTKHGAGKQTFVSLPFVSILRGS